MPEQRHHVTDGKNHAGESSMDVIYTTDPADYYYVAQNVPCQTACPAYTNIPGYIRCAYEGRYGRSYELNKVVNLFPGVLGRICSRPCEKKCRHGEPELGQPVAICHIKRSVADFKESGHVYKEELLPALGKKVCVVGAGPAGLAAAHDLSALGFQVTVLEALEEPGGMLRYGIPAFRLPRDILKSEISGILRLGVTLKTGVRVGTDISIEALLTDYDAILVAAGCYVSKPLDVPGEDLPGVYSGLRFVMDVASGNAPVLASKVLVIGAGFTAFDCARLALRLGADTCTMCLRATEHDLRVTEEEILEAKREGIKILGLTLSRRIIGSQKVEGVEFVRTRPGELLQNGRRRMIPIEGSEFVLAADSVIVAIGQGSEPFPSPGEKDERGVLRADVQTFRSSVSKLYVTGDFLTGPSTVIESIARGRQAAQRIAEDLTGMKSYQWTVRIEQTSVTDRERSWDYILRSEMPTLDPVEYRLKSLDLEVERGLGPDEAREESKRCYLCYLHYEIDITRCIYCRYCIDVAPRDCIKLAKDVITNEMGAITGFVETSNWKDVNAVVIDNSRCIRCGECLRVCPVDCISVSRVELVERMLPGGRN
jgi:glutamate synthase (NADPH) small chain